MTWISWGLLLFLGYDWRDVDDGFWGRGRDRRTQGSSTTRLEGEGDRLSPNFAIWISTVLDGRRIHKYASRTRENIDKESFETTEISLTNLIKCGEVAPDLVVPLVPNDPNDEHPLNFAFPLTRLQPKTPAHGLHSISHLRGFLEPPLQCGSSRQQASHVHCRLAKRAGHHRVRWNKH